MPLSPQEGNGCLTLSKCLITSSCLLFMNKNQCLTRDRCLLVNNRWVWYQNGGGGGGDMPFVPLPGSATNLMHKRREKIPNLMITYLQSLGQCK